MVEIKDAKYFVVRPSIETGKPEVVPFMNKLAVDGFINGCSNPEDCIPFVVRRLRIEYRVKDLSKVRKK